MDFNTGDLIVWGIAGLAVCGLLGVCVSAFIEWYRWKKQPIFEWPAMLLGSDFHPSTERVSAMPIVTSGGVGVGISSSGSPEEDITFWDCGKY
jgi:hypothetical protein